MAQEPDPVAALLTRSPLSNAQRADLWDAFESSPDLDTFTASLEALSVPQHVKAQLWDLKSTQTQTAPDPAPAAPQMAQDAPERTWGQTATDVAIGAGKGLANTAIGLGEYVGAPVLRQIPGVRDYVATPEQFSEARQAFTTPTNTPQRVGQMAEQVGEFFAPVGAPAKLKKAAEVVKSGVLSLAQSGSPVAAGASAALTAVVPGGGAVKKVAGALETSAQKSMAQALGATKEWAKSDAAKLAPEMLKRGIGGSRPAMLEHAESVAARVGADLNAAYKAATAAGETVPGLIVRGNVQLASDALHVLTPAGKRIPLPGYETAIAQLGKLDEFIGQLGDDIPVDKGAFVKRAWDDIVSSAGLYGQKATASASEKAMAWSFREAANSFRSLLNTNPTIAALNKEAGFWIGLRDVLEATKLRTQAQGYGVIQAGGSMVGGVVGGMSGEGTMDRVVSGAMGALAGQQFVRLLQSPAWRSKVAAPLKHQLAEALASGSVGRTADVVRRITASVPAQFRPALAQ